MIHIGEDNFVKCLTEIIDIKSKANRLTTQQVLNKIYEYVGIRSCFVLPFMQVVFDSFENFNSLNNYMHSINLSATILSQRRKHSN